jgi:hypothetical protein
MTNTPMTLKDYNTQKSVWSNPTSCWHINLFKESQRNGGRNSCSSSLTCILRMPVFYTKSKRRNFWLYSYIQEVAEGLIGSVGNELEKSHANPEVSILCHWYCYPLEFFFYSVCQWNNFPTCAKISQNFYTKNWWIMNCFCTPIKPSSEKNGTGYKALMKINLLYTTYIW